MTEIRAGKKFWHKPAWSKPWHLYDSSGTSMCLNWALIGTGKPKNLRYKRPKVYCEKCERVK